MQQVLARLFAPLLAALRWGEPFDWDDAEP